MFFFFFTNFKPNINHLPSSTTSNPIIPPTTPNKHETNNHTTQIPTLSLHPQIHPPFSTNNNTQSTLSNEDRLDSSPEQRRQRNRTIRQGHGRSVLATPSSCWRRPTTPAPARAPPSPSPLLFESSSELGRSSRRKTRRQQNLGDSAKEANTKPKIEKRKQKNVENRRYANRVIHTRICYVLFVDVLGNAWHVTWEAIIIGNI